MKIEHYEELKHVSEISPGEVFCLKGSYYLVTSQKELQGRMCIHLSSGTVEYVSPQAQVDHVDTITKILGRKK